MVLDVETLLVVNAANMLVIGATLPLIMGRELSKAAGNARNSLIIQALGVVAIVVSDLWPEQWLGHVVSAIAVSLLALGHWLMFRGLQGWLGPRRGEFFSRSLIVLAPIGYLLLAQSFPMRTAWANLVMILQLLLIGQATLWPSTRLGGRWRWVILGCTTSMAFFTAARTVLVLFYPALYPNFLAPHPVNVVSMLAANVTLVLAAVATLVAWREEAEAQLTDQAHTDGLTELANRHGWDNLAPAMVDQARRHASPLALLMIDLDHFKRINDTQGHETGDKVLKMVGAVLAGNRRTSDLAARLGGEEFAVLLPQTSQEAALQFELRLRQAMFKTSQAQPKLAVNYSAGLAMLSQQDFSLQDLMARADAALYHAKARGRGCLEVSR
jgi:diguanylate cyclase (GGDEF)-like protein